MGAPPHWYAPVAGQTKPLSITGGKLLVTADTDTLRAGGENTNFLKNVGKLTVSVEVAGVSGLLPCTSLVGQNVTNAALEGCDPLGSRIRSILLEFIPVRGGGAVGLLAFEKRSLLKYTKIEQKLGSFYVVSQLQRGVCFLRRGGLLNLSPNPGDLTAHVGKQATLHIRVDGSALLYMLGFGS